MYKYLLVVFLIAILIYLVYSSAAPRVASAHVINLDSSSERLAQFYEKAKDSQLEITRWRGVNGKALGPADMIKYNIPRDVFERYKSKNRLGVIGCYMSHATLLKHLETMPSRNNDFHIIFEDDAVVPKNLESVLRKHVEKLPSDWDLLQLYNNQPNTVPWAGTIHKLGAGKGNWGNVAYVVRHGALPKINAHLSIMRKPVDNQMLEMSQIWKWYCIVPNLVTTEDGGQTTLND
jgi:GR25 family glycosyltransferase involved in LPS biosynthesis